MNKIQKNIFAFAFMCIGILHANAQSNYQEGYIITNEQDTISGWLDFRTDKMNGEICRFKLELSGKEQFFLPGQIFGYRFLQSGKFYISKTIAIDNITIPAFVEYLIHGVMNLYFYVSNDSNVIGYYIFEDENKAIFTISKQIDKIITKDDGGTVLRKDNKYTTDLNFVFGDIKEISRKLPTAKFTHNTMIDFVKEYHSQICKTEEECIEFETKTDDKNVLVKYSIYGGYAWLNSKQTGTKNSSGAFTFGGRIELIIPRWNKSISFLLDLSYAKNKGIYDNNYSVSQIGIDVGGKYTYHKGSVRPAAEAGIALRIEKYPYNFSYAWCQFIGLGVDFLISNNKFISLILDYTISSPYHTNICTFKLGYKF